MIVPDLFRADYFRMTGKQIKPGLRSLVDILLRQNIGLMFWFRRYTAGNKGIFARFMLYHYSRKYGLEFHPSAKIGEGLYIGHPYNITLGNGVVLGRNVNIHKGATIGAENRGKRRGTPTIGDCVYIGIHATVVGNISIGDDVMIAPGAFVNFDVPSHSIVLGNPGVIRHCEDATKGYVINRI